MGPERNESQRHNAQEHAPERLVQQELECASETLDLARIVVKACLHDEPTDDEEDDSAGEHAEAAQSDRALSLPLAHLRAFQVFREGGPVGFQELPQADTDC